MSSFAKILKIATFPKSGRAVAAMALHVPESHTEPYKPMPPRLFLKCVTAHQGLEAGLVCNPLLVPSVHIRGPAMQVGLVHAMDRGFRAA